MIRLGSPMFGDEAVASVARVIESGQLVQGECVAELEGLVAESCGTRHALAVSSGTAALHLALLALEIGPGDEVIVPDYTYPATANVVEIVGATPVLVDIDPATMNLSVSSLDSLVSDATRAIMPVHLFGLPCEMGAVLEVANQHGISVIEDAACALGATLGGRAAGSLGTIGCFSLHPRKVISTGEGGLLVTDDDHLADRLRALRSHGLVVKSDGRMELERPGLNYRMTDFQGALGVEQMGRLGEFISKRRDLATRYREELRGVERIRLPSDGEEHVYQSFVLMLDEEVSRDDVVAKLAGRDVQTTLGTYSLSLQPFYRRHAGADACVSGREAQLRSLSLPMHVHLTDSDVEVVCRELRNALS